MSAQKYIISLAFIVAVFLAINTVPINGAISQYAAAANKSNHLIVGYRVPGDRLVLRQNIVKESSWMRVVTEERTFNVSSWERITMIQSLDQKTNGNGASASLLKGGPGFFNVTIRYKSQRGHGINHVMEIYAR
ncbi:probable salivary secreted peptide [Nylanderia fulva]|uniref:probable salivary secreted peptide n=1 Tax=Nylanderia fulva TaxID=613905 RepID=UPI0010FB4A62|nr:probable salivary secreted peptide [Nylanderia fulva]